MASSAPQLPGPADSCGLQCLPPIDASDEEVEANRIEASCFNTSREIDHGLSSVVSMFPSVKQRKLHYSGTMHRAGAHVEHARDGKRRKAKERELAQLRWRLECETL